MIPFTFEQFEYAFEHDPFRGIWIAPYEGITYGGRIVANLDVKLLKSAKRGLVARWRNPDVSALLLLEFETGEGYLQGWSAGDVESAENIAMVELPFEEGGVRNVELFAKRFREPERLIVLAEEYQKRKDYGVEKDLALAFYYHVLWMHDREYFGPNVMVSVMTNIPLNDLEKAFEPIFKSQRPTSAALEIPAFMLRADVAEPEPSEPESARAPEPAPFGVDPYAGEPDMPPPYYGDFPPRPPRYPYSKERVAAFRRRKLVEGYHYNPDDDVEVTRGYVTRAGERLRRNGR